MIIFGIGNCKTMWSRKVKYYGKLKVIIPQVEAKEGNSINFYHLIPVTIHDYFQLS